MMALTWEVSRYALEDVGEGIVNTAASLVGVASILGFAALLAVPRWKRFSLTGD